MLSPTRKTFFPGRARGRSISRKAEDVAVPDAERIDMAARPLRRPAEAAELEGVGGEAARGEMPGQEFPTGRMGAEAVDEEENSFGRAGRRRGVPAAIKKIRPLEFGHGRIITKGPHRLEGTVAEGGQGFRGDGNRPSRTA